MNHRTTAWFVVLVTLLLPHRALAAWPHDPGTNVPVITAPGSQQSIIAASDGSGGTIVAWADMRAGNLDLYAKRVAASGQVLWTTSGVPVCTAAGDQTDPAIIADGSGGAIMTWVDRRSGNFEIYAQRIDSLGQVQWTPDGVLLSTGGTNFKRLPALVPSIGGAIVAWTDFQSGHSGVYAQRVDTAGTPLWTVNGVPLMTVAGSYSGDVQLASDGKGGAIACCGHTTTGSVADVLAQRVAANGLTRWTPGGLVIETNWNVPRLCADTKSGAFVTWEAGIIKDLYGQRVDSTGALQWGAAGLAINTETGSQQDAKLALDGADGVYVVWRDARGGYYGQRLNGSGARLWDTHGVALATGSIGTQSSPSLIGDGAGGGRFAWSENRSGSDDIFAQRFDANGTPLWGASGVTVSNNPATQLSPVIVDGLSGTLIVFQDNRNSSVNHVYAQRVDSYGFVGDVAAAIVSVRDVVNDQGGHVRVSWLPSPLDTPADDQVESYRVLRRTAPGSYAEVGAQPSLGLEGYSMVLPTAVDSTGVSDGTTAFVVRARSLSDTTRTWDSAPDSGHSVDNLPPAMPVQFAARYDAGAARLSWQSDRGPDFAGCRLYRGPSADFVPGPGNLLSEVAGDAYVDLAPNIYAYKLIAVDTHGNVSPPAEVVPPGAVLAGTWPAAVAFSPPRPNPARGATAFEFALPQAGQVRIGLYDVGGRRVLERDLGTMSVGAHFLPLALEDESGRALASGVYLVRLECAGAAIVRRLTVVR